MTKFKNSMRAVKEVEEACGRFSEEFKGDWKQITNKLRKRFCRRLIFDEEIIKRSKELKFGEFWAADKFIQSCRELHIFYDRVYPNDHVAQRRLIDLILAKLPSGNFLTQVVEALIEITGSEYDWKTSIPFPEFLDIILKRCRIAEICAKASNTDKISHISEKKPHWKSDKSGPSLSDWAKNSSFKAVYVAKVDESASFEDLISKLSCCEVKFTRADRFKKKLAFCAFDNAAAATKALDAYPEMKFRAFEHRSQAGKPENRDFPRGGPARGSSRH